MLGSPCSSAFGRCRISLRSATRTLPRRSRRTGVMSRPMVPGREKTGEDQGRPQPLDPIRGAAARRGALPARRRGGARAHPPARCPQAAPQGPHRRTPEQVIQRIAGSAGVLRCSLVRRVWIDNRAVGWSLSARSPGNCPERLRCSRVAAVPNPGSTHGYGYGGDPPPSSVAPGTTRVICQPGSVVAYLTSGAGDRLPVRRYGPRDTHSAAESMRHTATGTAFAFRILFARCGCSKLQYISFQPKRAIMATTKTATLTFRVAPGLKAALREAAQLEHRSIAISGGDRSASYSGKYRSGGPDTTETQDTTKGKPSL